jgi:hypothetical protein
VNEEAEPGIKSKARARFIERTVKLLYGWGLRKLIQSIARV